MKHDGTSERFDHNMKNEEIRPKKKEEKKAHVKILKGIPNWF